MGLLDLPAEVLLLIVSQLSRTSDLKHLCGTSRALHKLVTPSLYRCITLHMRDYSLLWPCLESLQEFTGHASRHLRHLASLRIKANLRWWDTGCYHNLYDEEAELSDDFSDIPHDERRRIKTEPLAYFVKNLLSGCKDGHLRHFSWEVGSCVPAGVLGYAGILHEKQAQIESIRLITDFECGQRFDEVAPEPISLHSFRNLTRFSWVGIDQAEMLQKVLSDVSTQLVELELDFIDWLETIIRLGFEEFDEIWSDGEDEDDSDGSGSMCIFTDSVLNLGESQSHKMFPRLRTLSLSSVSLRRGEKALLNALQISSLQNLTLRSCPGWTKFLELMSRSNASISLKTLEVQSLLEDDRSLIAVQAISEFLKTFEGLENFSFYVTNPTVEPHRVWDSVKNHRSTLDTMSYHCISVEPDEYSTFGGEVDLLQPYYLPDSWEARIQGNLEHPGLSDFVNPSCIGLCCDPHHLKRFLSPATTSPNLKVIHIRKRGDHPDIVERLGRLNGAPFDNEFIIDSLVENPSSSARCSDNYNLDGVENGLLELAEWAFGSSGLASLELIAHGDFSFHGRYASQNVLLCRSGSPTIGTDGPNRCYRLVREEDLELRELLDKYMHILQACPTGTLQETR